MIQEADGNLDNPDLTVEAINNAIGQGNVQIPPIQMGVATAAIANDGTVFKPYLVQSVGTIGSDVPLKETEPTILNQLNLDPDVLATVREGMCGVISNPDLGTANYVFYAQGEPTPTYNACGKTGTAEAGERSNAWFIAFAPAEAPQIAIVVSVPRAGREGSEVAAPIARRILDYFFNSPQAAYPEWWNNLPFIPLEIPVGGGGG
jgi:penicillin-binding protein 2